MADNAQNLLSNGRKDIWIDSSTIIPMQVFWQSSNAMKGCGQVPT